VEISADDDGIAVLKYDWETGQRVPGMEYLSRVWFGRGEIVRVEPAEFEARVAELKCDLRDLRDLRSELSSLPTRPPRGRSDLKDERRALEKVIEDLGGDASWLLDIASSVIAFRNVADLRNALAKVQAERDVVRVLDRHHEPLPCGYPDVLVNLRMQNEHVVEMRLMLQAVSDFWQTHDAIAEVAAAIAAPAMAEKRNLTRHEAASVIALRERLRQKYRAMLA
jgi:hypothetical protein